MLHPSLMQRVSVTWEVAQAKLTSSPPIQYQEWLKFLRMINRNGPHGLFTTTLS
ncbi:hypothetical protein NTGM5_10033 [Candidatus Nitrotoga sp. M5]|nr:hypothetical protein NTGM5_10033 [Candidatus Nitrotoga sp. M5]